MLQIIPIPKDMNYEVQDFMAIEPTIGTTGDFHNLLEKAAELDLKIIIDFVSFSEAPRKSKILISYRFQTTQAYFMSGFNCPLTELKLLLIFTSGRSAQFKTVQDRSPIIG